MMDLVMILSLAAAFGLVYSFIIWCGRVVGEAEGERS